MFSFGSILIFRTPASAFVRTDRKKTKNRNGTMTIIHVTANSSQQLNFEIILCHKYSLMIFQGFLSVQKAEQATEKAFEAESPQENN